jgi:copper homeostasis protein
MSKADRVQPPAPILIEIIVQTVDDARAAADGGADRLEVVRAIRDGGLTPSLTVVEAIARAVSLPLRVMVRENDGFQTTPEEIHTMRAAAAELGAMKIDGIVAGFASDGQLSLDVFDSVVSAAPDLPVTFHRAFDSVSDPILAIDTLSSNAQIDGILTSGGEGSAQHRCARLLEYAARAGSRLAIIAGGGVDLEAFRLVSEKGAATIIHVGRAARDGKNAEGPVTAASVRRLRDLADRGV